MKMKRFFIALLAVLMLTSMFITTYAADLPVGYWNIANPHRYLIFATDGGSYIKPLEKSTGEYVSLESFVPIKQGYIFDGWYADPRTKVERMTEVTLDENIVVYAKWIDDGTPKPMSEKHIGATNEEILDFGNHIDEKTGIPVTALWIQQNNKLKELMAEYNEKFNN